MKKPSFVMATIKTCGVRFTFSICFNIFLLKIFKERYAYVSIKRNRKLLAKVLVTSPRKIGDFLEEIYDDFEFNRHINWVYKTINRLDFGQISNLLELYIIIRSLRPRIVVETGVASGLSSTFILYALEKNDYGHLFSIDLSPHTVKYDDSIYVELPKESESGWAIPKHLNQRWTLILGNSLIKLPNLCKNLGIIDIFIHDSEHTYNVMFNEYKSVWLNLRQGGLLISDDIVRNNAFHDFSREVNRKPVYLLGPRIFPLWNHKRTCDKINAVGVMKK